MTRQEALGVVMEAAQSWADEIDQYIAPAHNDEDYDAWMERAGKITEALVILEDVGL